MSKPNILFIMADQMSAKAMPSYGHKLVRTPAISRLAEDGVVFDKAYCSSPLCGPSRLSMMSGLHPHKVGAYDNAPEFPASFRPSRTICACPDISPASAARCTSPAPISCTASRNA